MAAAAQDTSPLAVLRTDNVLSIVLGGGAGTRLQPLTKPRAKPAVALAGGYRLVDIPISNTLNSNMRKIFVLTQYNSRSLNRHVARAYASPSSGFGSDGFVEVLAATQTSENEGWFMGTADAVRQYLWAFEAQDDVDDYLVLSGDHLYRMDYREFLLTHRESGADVTIAVLPTGEERASSFGLAKIVESGPQAGSIAEFAEKPKDAEALAAMRVDTTVLGLSAEEARELPYIASMGIYVFKREVLGRLLRERPDDYDFGSQLIPAAREMGMRVQAHLFNGYWEDIGTIKSFFGANLALAGPDAKFNFYDERAPIFTRQRNLPPTKMHSATVECCIIGEGCLIGARSTLRRAVIGVRTLIGDACAIEDAMIMGADAYDKTPNAVGTGAQRVGGGAVTDAGAAAAPSPMLPTGVGAGTVLRRCIVDKDARIGKDCRIVSEGNAPDKVDRSASGVEYWVRDGIIVIPKKAVIPDGTVISA